MCDDASLSPSQRKHALHEASRHALEQELKHLNRRAESEEQTAKELAVVVAGHMADAAQARTRAAQIADDLKGSAANDDGPADFGHRRVR